MQLEHNKNNYIEASNAWFIFTLLYLVFDYGRPQDIIPIGALKIPMIIILILIFFLLTNGGLEIAFYKQLKWVSLFIGLLGLYIPFALNNYFAWQTTKIMLLYMPFILSAVICFNSIHRLKTMFFICVAIMIYVAIYSILHKGMGSGNYFRDENDVALYINMWLPFCYYLFLVEKKRMLKIFYAFGLIVGLFSIVMSVSRGGFVGLLVLSIVIWLISPTKLFTLLIIGIFAFLLFNFTSDEYWKSMSTITDMQEDTASARLLSWQTAWDMFLDNPLGVGGNNFIVRFPEYQGDRFSRVMWGRAAHSLWFTLIPELGIIGIFIYLKLIIFNIKDILFLMKLKGNEDFIFLQQLSYAFLASIAGFFAAGSFLSVLYYPHYWYLIGFLMSTVKIAKNIPNDTNI